MKKFIFRSCLGISFLAVLWTTALGSDNKPEAVEPDAVATKLIGRRIFAHAVRSLAFNPNSKVLAIGRGSGRLELKTIGHTAERSLQVHDRWVFDIVFTSDGKTIATAGGDMSIAFWDANSLQLLHHWQVHQNDVHALALSPDERSAYSAGDDMLLQQVDVATGEINWWVKAHDEPIPALAIHPRGHIVATASRDDTVRVFDTSDGKQLHVFDDALNDILTIKFSPDGRWLAWAGYDTAVRVADSETFESVVLLKEHKDRVFALAFHPQQPWIASAGEDGVILVWEVPTKRLIYRQQLGPDADVSSLAFSRDGRWLAAGSSTGEVRLFDAANGRHEMTIPIPAGDPPAE